jgi:DNA-binding response OmpR family regulator
MPKRVLLIDDDERLVAALQIRLTAAGYDIFTACDGDDGLSEAAVFQPDAIILDVRMPKIEGFEVCRVIRSVPELRDIPIIILSATAESPEILEAGGNVFMRKPYHLPRLLSVLAELIDRPPADKSGKKRDVA